MTESKYTRNEFVRKEIAAGVDAQGIPGVDFNATSDWREAFDPDVVEAIQRRAEWNAQAAERAGVRWCPQEPSPIYQIQTTNDPLRFKCRCEAVYDFTAENGRLVAVTIQPHGAASWMLDSGAAERADVAADLCALSIATRKADDDLHRRINGHADQIAVLEEEIADIGAQLEGQRGESGKLEAIAKRVESEWQIQGQKYTADLRMTREQVKEVDTSLIELRDMGQRTIDRLEQARKESQEQGAGLNRDRLALAARVEKLEAVVGKLLVG